MEGQTSYVSVMRDGLFLEYREKGSVNPERTAESTIRFTFTEELPGRFHITIDTEVIEQHMYAVAYGEKILVDENLLTAQGIPMQYGGLCPLLLEPSGRAPGAEVRWPWDGAGIQAVPTDPRERLYANGVLRGPIVWNAWDSLKLERTDALESSPMPVAYYHCESGILVGIEYGAEREDGLGRFIYCDTILVSSNAEEILPGDGPR